MKTTPVLNHLLWIAYRDKRDADMTPRKVQKLLYLLHGAYLVETNTCLLTEPFVKGQYGPVLNSLEEELSQYEGVPIDDYIKEFDVQSCEVKPFFVSLDSLPQFQSILETVWTKYGALPLVTLSSMLNADGTAWSKTSAGQVISNELIRDEHKQRHRFSR